MKRALIVLLSCLPVLLCLSGCGLPEKRYASRDYTLEAEYKEDYRILQLSDIHFSVKDDLQKHCNFMDLTVEEANPDMIVITGDLFTFADKRTAKELFAWVDSHGIPWTVTFGNHDEQCYFPVDWLTSYLTNYGSNCLFKDIQDDDVFGNANFAIDLTDGEEIVSQVIIMDSNRYNYGEYLGYDYIKQDQIDWYERLVNDTTAQNGAVVPSLLFFHIPLPEFEEAWEEAESGHVVPDYGSNFENVCAPKRNSGFFGTIEALGSTKGIFVGHDHLNNSCICYNGVYLSYGVKSTDRIYYDNERLGGQVITVHRDGSLDFETYYHRYEELD